MKSMMDVFAIKIFAGHGKRKKIRRFKTKAETMAFLEGLGKAGGASVFLDDDNWERLFGPELGKDGDFLRYETYGADLAKVLAMTKESPGRVWTCVDSDDGDLIFVDGYHFVNRQYYLITKIPSVPNVYFQVD